MIHIITGHYGSGKTEIAVNMAMAANKPIIIDLDIVNPYFRTSDVREMLEKSGATLIAPQYANTNVDMPTLPAAVYSALSGDGETFIDVGGDDAGAIALGQYNSYLSKKPYEMYFVINANRPMTDTPKKTLEVLREVEAASRLSVTKLINNTNIMAETTAETVLKGQRLVDEVSRLSGILIGAVSARRGVLEMVDTHLPKLPLTLYLNLPWERGVDV